MKNKFTILSALLLLTSLLLSGCGQPKASLVEGKVNVVASFYPMYYFAQQIGGEHVNAINLIPAGVEPHDWTPKSRDMKNMTNAELFVYQGAGFEGWVEDFLPSLAKDSKVKVVEASHDVNLIKAEESTEEGHDHEHDHENEWDPHAWLSIKNAKKMSENIMKGLIEADPSHKTDYENNYKQFAAKLDSLDSKFTESLAKAPKKEIAVTHQAFGYLCRDYGLTQMPIMGMSPDSEPTAKDLMKVSQFIKEHNIKYIFFEELVSDKMAKTLAKDTGVGTLVLNPLEGLTEDQQKSGETYLTLMERNLQNLLKALQ